MGGRDEATLVPTGPPPPLRMLRPHYYPARGARCSIYLRRELQPVLVADGGAGRPAGRAMHATDSQTAEFAGGDTLCKQPEARDVGGRHWHCGVLTGSR